ncbi:MAG: lysophospholipid acyltransferase family protein [Gammaproteobacteria bacterium]|nr:MAG: lysophospholipid acyltransferase family protein [Gammaproteobacteria bacterium]
MSAVDQQPALPVLYLRSVLFWLGFATFTLVFAFLLVLSFPFPLEKRFALTRAWSSATIRWLNITCNLRHEVQGTENIPDRAGIIFAKHQSTWETLILNFWFEKQSWVVKRELLWVPVFGWGMYMMNPIALNRGSGKKAVDQLVEQGRERLDKGNWIVIFPEGTRTAPGTKGRYRMGGAILAERTGASITPIAHNAGEYWPRRKFVKRPGVIKIRIGPSINTKNKPAKEILAEAEHWIESEMARITTLQTARR